MKQYNLKAEKRNLSFGELTVIALGERGRGRYETLIPRQSDIADGDFVIPVPTKSGKVKIIKGGEKPGWIARVCCAGCYTRGTVGSAFVHQKDEKKVKVLASGHGAEGDAGRIGYWEDFILQIEDNTLLRVKPHGGYKTPAYFIFFGEDKALEMSRDELFIWADAYAADDYSLDGEVFLKIERIH